MIHTWDNEGQREESEPGRRAHSLVSQRESWRRAASKDQWTQPLSLKTDCKVHHQGLDSPRVWSPDTPGPRWGLLLRSAEIAKHQELSENRSLTYFCTDNLERQSEQQAVEMLQC